MKIFFPFEGQKKGFLGVTTFALKFKSGMESRGHEVFFDYQSDYDILFMVVQAPFQYLLDAKCRKKPIVQRMDGVFYWSVSGWKFPLLNAKAILIRHFFTDFTIYQSHYSQYSVKKFLGKKRHDRSSVIYNGVDINLFSPNGKKIVIRDNPNQKIFFTASAFRREDQLIPIFQALEKYKKKYGENFKFLIAGTFSGKMTSLQEKYKHFKYAIFLGKIKNEDLPQYERAADVFLLTHLNPPCPNNIIEAMACGLPICGIADGAMPEIIEEGKNGLLIKTPGDAFWKTRIINTDDFSDNLHTILESKKSFSEKSRSLALEKFSLNSMVEQYIISINKLLK